MRRALSVLALCALLLSAPARSHARPRIGWLITGIGTTAASVGCTVVSVVCFSAAGEYRKEADANSSSTGSYYYDYEVGGKYYNDYGYSAKQFADILQIEGWVYGGVAVATGVVAVVAWTKVQAPPRPRADLGPAPLFSYAGGELSLGVPELRPDFRGGVQARLLRAEF